MFREIMQRISNATFRFYDVTPVGRLLNRLTGDVGTVDGPISMQFLAVSWQAIAWTSSIFVFATVTPTFLVFSLALTGVFFWIFLTFLPTSPISETSGDGLSKPVDVQLWRFAEWLDHGASVLCRTSLHDQSHPGCGQFPET